MGKTKDILNNFPSFLKINSDSNNYKLINSYGLELDSITSHNDNLLKTIQLSTSTGSNLDDIAKIFKLLRLDGENDSDLRDRIKAFWQGAIGGGTETSLINMLKLLLNIPESNITITEITALKIKIKVIIEDNTSDIVKVKNIILRSKAAGTFIIIDFDFNLNENLTTLDSYELLDTSNLFKISESEIEGDEILG